MRSLGNQRFQIWEVSTRLPKVSSTLQEVGNSFYLGYFPYFGLEMVGCSSLVERPLPRKTRLCLSKDMRLP